MKIKWVVVLVLVLGLVGFGAYRMFFQEMPPITKTLSINLEVKALPDFALSSNILDMVSPIDRTIGFTLSVESINEFAGNITFEVVGLPPEMIVSYFPGNMLTLGAGETRGISVEIVIPNDVNLIGTYTITVTAESVVYN